MIHIVLIKPEIPPNTGNIIRLCANTGYYLHLVKPLGFDLSDRNLIRAGLDYHDLTNLQIHNSLNDFINLMYDYENKRNYDMAVMTDMSESEEDLYDLKYYFFLVIFKKIIIELTQIFLHFIIKIIALASSLSNPGKNR